MNDYTITFEKSAKKFLKSQNAKLQTKILSAISNLPYGTDIKRLHGYNLYRMRINDIRIIYSIDHDIRIINIENIDNRGDIYKKY